MLQQLASRVRAGFTGASGSARTGTACELSREWSFRAQGLGEPAACNYALCSLIYGYLKGKVTCYFERLGFPAWRVLLKAWRNLFGSCNNYSSHHVHPAWDCLPLLRREVHDTGRGALLRTIVLQSIRVPHLLQQFKQSGHCRFFSTWARSGFM